MLHVHWRMAELWTIKKSRELTEKELDEMSICLQHNANYASKLVKLYNLSGIASQIDDMEWLQDICRKIDELEIEYKAKTYG